MPAYYRTKAAELREMASKFTEQSIKAQLLEVAADYDRLAERVERDARREQ